MRPRLFRFPVILMLAGAALGGFAYGLLVAKAKLPPYRTIHRVASRLAQWPPLDRWFGPPPADVTYDGGGQPGRWNPAQGGAPDGAGNDAALKERLAALGYLSGYEEATGRTNVTIHRAELASPGVNLYVSGHGPEAILMDMDGRVLHRWRLAFDDAFPSRPEHDRQRFLEYWRRVHPYPNGDLLALYSDGGIVKLDRTSRLVWAAPGSYHHEAVVDASGYIHTLLREERLVSWIDEERPVFDDLIVVLDPAGRPVRRISILDALTGSPYASLLERLSDPVDIFHANSVQPLDGRHAGVAAAFRAGNYLISLRRLNAIVIVDAETERVVWALAGMWVSQHEPTLLDTGRMIVFDNLGHAGRSQVLEFDPLTQQIVWAFKGDEENGFFSATCGAVQRLPNGNTLITESDGGRAFELTAGDVVAWEFYNPHRAGEHGELVATLFDVLRLAPEFGKEWLGPRDQR